MRIPESDQESAHSVSLESAPQAGPSSLGLDGPGPSNGHTNGNGFTLPSTNGFTNGTGVVGNGVQKHGKSVAKVSLLGTALYPDGSYVDREEFVRLVIQSLRDVGYMYVKRLFCVASMPYHACYVQRVRSDPRGRVWLHDGSTRSITVSPIHLGSIME